MTGRRRSSAWPFFGFSDFVRCAPASRACFVHALRRCMDRHACSARPAMRANGFANANPIGRRHGRGGNDRPGWGYRGKTGLGKRFVRNRQRQGTGGGIPGQSSRQRNSWPCSKRLFHYGFRVDASIRRQHLSAQAEPLNWNGKPSMVQRRSIPPPSGQYAAAFSDFCASPASADIPAMPTKTACAPLQIVRGDVFEGAKTMRGQGFASLHAPGVPAASSKDCTSCTNRQA